MGSHIREIKPDADTSYYFRVGLAGKCIEVECMYKETYRAYRDYADQKSEPDAYIKISYNDILETKRILSQDRIPNISVEEDNIAITYDTGHLEPLALQRKISDIMPSFNTYLMHGSVVAKDDYAYMFTAPSGTGKTTRTRLWLEEYPGSFVVCGDKPLIEIKENEAVAYGTPWGGKEGWNTNTKAPLKAIFLLERADDTQENTVEEIDIGKAFPFLIRQIYCPTDSVSIKKLITLFRALDGKTKIFRFRSTPTREAVRLAFETVEKG